MVRIIFGTTISQAAVSAPASWLLRLSAGMADGATGTSASGGGALAA
ncbi:MAG TPA: hypothetical protein VK708_04005 [Bryobacteraceae bacterium]|nr:hypothetical protein [Bryobacteraceae bacterium]